MSAVIVKLMCVGVLGMYILYFTEYVLVTIAMVTGLSFLVIEELISQLMRVGMMAAKYVRLFSFHNILLIASQICSICKKSSNT